MGNPGLGVVRLLLGERRLAHHAGRYTWIGVRARNFVAQAGYTCDINQDRVDALRIYLATGQLPPLTPVK